MIDMVGPKEMPRYSFRRKDLDEIMESLMSGSIKSEDMEIMDYRNIGDDTPSIYAGSVVAKDGDIEATFRPLNARLTGNHWYDDSKLSNSQIELKKFLCETYKLPANRRDLIVFISLPLVAGLVWLFYQL